MFTAAALLFTLLAAHCALVLAAGSMEEAGGLGGGGLGGVGGSEGGGGGGGEGGGGGGGGGWGGGGAWGGAPAWREVGAALALLGTRTLWADWRLEVIYVYHPGSHPNPSPSPNPNPNPDPNRDSNPLAQTLHPNPRGERPPWLAPQP